MKVWPVWWWLETGEKKNPNYLSFPSIFFCSRNLLFLCLFSRYLLYGPYVQAQKKFSAHDKHYSEVRFCLPPAMERNCVQCYYSTILWPVSAFYHLIGSHTKGLWDFHLAAAWWQRRNKNCALLHSQGWDMHPICTLPRHLFPSPFPMHNNRPIECLFFFHFQANPLHWFCFKANPPWFLVVDLSNSLPTYITRPKQDRQVLNLTLSSLNCYPSDSYIYIIMFFNKLHVQWGQVIEM